MSETGGKILLMMTPYGPMLSVPGIEGKPEAIHLNDVRYVRARYPGESEGAGSEVERTRSYWYLAGLMREAEYSEEEIEIVRKALDRAAFRQGVDYGEGDDIRSALVRSFPHFDADPEKVTVERVRKLGDEYAEMMHTWAPFQRRIEFVDDEGNVGVLEWDEGDSSVGIPSGYYLTTPPISAAPEGAVPVTVIVYDENDSLSVDRASEGRQGIVTVDGRLHDEGVFAGDYWLVKRTERES